MLIHVLAAFSALAAALLAATLILIWHRWRRTLILQNVGLQLNSTIKRKELLRIIMETAAETMKAEGSSIILVDEEKGDLYFEVATGEKNEEVKQIRLAKGEGIAGWVAETGRSVLVADPSKDPRWSNRVSVKVNVPTRNMLCVPVVSNGRMLGVLQVINRKGRRGFHRSDLKLLEMIAVPTAVALENMLLYEALLRAMENIRETTAAKERIESELKIAQDIQRGLLPGEALRAGSVTLHAFLVPARVVGGDFYYFSELEDGKLLVCLGDVSDKGIPAALFMSSLMIRIQSKASPDLSPAQIAEAINRDVCREDSAMFATIFLAVIDTRTGELSFCDGGHCPPLVLNGDGVRTLETAKRLPIGAFADEKYEDRETRLNPGETLVLYTDGITDAENPQGERFGTERLKSALGELAAGSPRDVTQGIREKVTAFAAGHPQSDDIAVLALQFGDKD